MTRPFLVLSVLGLAACEHAEFSLPSSHGRTPPRAPRAVAVDPAKVPSSVVFVTADLGPDRRALVPFACWDHGRRSLAEGQACAGLVPPSATLRCVGGDPIRLGAKVTSACGEGFEVLASAAASCEVAVWVASGLSPDVILLPSIEPQTTPVERASIAKVAPAPLEIAQAITIDLDGDATKDRMYVVRGAVLGAFGRAPEQILSLHGGRTDEGRRFRVKAVTDLDRDALPEIWITTTSANGAGREEHLERVASEGRAVAIATHRCREEPAPPTAEPAP